MFRTVDPVASTTLESYEHQQLLHRARRYIYIKGAVNAVIVLLFLLTFPPALRLRMVAIALADALLLVPYWFLVQRYPTLATCLSLGITSLAISAGDWVGGYQTGASGILYALLILGGHLVLIKPLSTYLISSLITAIYAGTIALEVNGVIPIHFPFTFSNLFRVVSLNVISMFGLTFLTGVITRLYRELLQRNKETKRRFEETMALYQISLDITAQLGMTELLKSILKRVVTLLGAEGGGICMYDPEREELRLAIGYGHAEEYVGTTLKPGEGMAGKVFQTGEPLIVDDYHTWEGGDPVYEADQPFTVLQVPLKWQDRIIGVLSISANVQERTFNQDDLWLATLFANQAAVVIENARLYQQTDEKLQTRVRELAALYAVAEMVNHSDLDAVLQLALDSAIRLTGMDVGGIVLLDPSTGDLFLRAHRGVSPELIRAVSRTKAGKGLMPRMLRSVLVADDLSKVPKDRRVAIEREGLQSLVSIPLKAQESVLGVMVIASHSPRTLAPEELELLAAVGNQVAVAVDRANLQAQELRAAILEERQHMAQQMHDDIVQTLGYLGLQVDSVMGRSSLAQNVEVQAELEEIRRVIEDAYERVGSSIMRLREDVPGYFDLGAALPEIISEFEKQTGCRVESRVDEDQLPHLRPSVTFQVTYIIREALTNVRKHSGADSVHLTLQGLEDGRVEVTIQDNGVGFDLDSDQQSGWGGFGLRFMRERAERIGGSLRIESGPGQGTRVVVSLPSG